MEEDERQRFRFGIPHSAIVTPHSAIPHSSLRHPSLVTPPSAYRTPHSAPRTPPFAFRLPPSAFRLPSSAFRFRRFALRTRLVSCLILLVFLHCISCARKPETGRVVIYSPHGKELLGEYEKLFEQKYLGTDVQWLDMGSQDVLDRLRSEKANPQADVWFGAPNTMFAEAAAAGLLESYRPTWAESVPPVARGENDSWYGTYFTPEVIAFNSNAVQGDAVPKDWDDLLQPRWKGRIIMRDPVASGTIRTIFAAMLFRFQQQGEPEKGFDWLRRLDAHTKEYTANSTLLFQKMARGEADITLWNMPDMELQREFYHYPFDYVFPASGTPYLTEGIALVRGGKAGEWARRYYEFVTSQESLALAARKFYRIPARKDIPASQLPERIWRARDQVQPMDLDWKILEQQTAGWMKRWENEIKSSSR
ncbi:MAG: extracellular solute-binding protein [Acidobacteria bacterium]|nr:extracellular solute-binding protein [Acidobacteriota bacterium]